MSIDEIQWRIAGAVIILWIWVGITDWYLWWVTDKELTISKWAEKQLPRGWDLTIVVVALVLTWAYAQKMFPQLPHAAPKIFAICLTHSVLSHMLLGHETYGKE